MCEARGLPVPARVADHFIPHHGDSNLFWFGELQSLCATCHNSTKKRTQPPYSLEVGDDGWPIDPNHGQSSEARDGGRGIGRPHVLIKTKGGGGRIKNPGLAKVRPPPCRENLKNLFLGVLLQQSASSRLAVQSFASVSCYQFVSNDLQCAVKPPSTGRPTPITKLAPGLHSHSTAAATSSARPRRPIDCCFMISAIASA